MALGWLATRDMRPASNLSPILRTATASPARTLVIADASEGMKTERKNSALSRQGLLDSIPFEFDPRRVLENGHLEFFHGQILEMAVVREWSKQIALPSHIRSERHSRATGEVRSWTEKTRTKSLETVGVVRYNALT